MAKKTKSSNRSLWLVPLAILLLGFVGRSLFYYRGVYIAPNVPTDQPEAVTIVHQPPQQSVNEPGSFSGVVVVDDAHINNFSPDEMSILYGRITAAGGEVRMYNGHEPLAESLRGAKAFVVAVNVLRFDAEDVQAVEAFVRNGGRLLLIGDPTRVVEANTLNTLAGRFGVLYQGDYIYNLVENDGSYLNVYVHEFDESPLTEGVEQLVLRAAGSLRASGDAIARGDDNTYSSLREVPGDVVAMALTQDGNVLALTDMTFLTAPYNSFGDNDRFIDNMVAFLLDGEREYHLLDFPNNFEGEVNVVFPHSSVLEQSFEEAAKLRQLLSSAGLASQLTNQHSDASAVVIDLYSDLDATTARTLRQDGIQIDAGVEIDGVGSFSASGSTLFHLHLNDEGNYQLFILADSAKSLTGGLNVLFDGKLDQCGLTDQTALCLPGSVATPTPTPNGSETPDGTTTPEVTGTPGDLTPTPTPSATPTASG